MQEIDDDSGSREEFHLWLEKAVNSFFEMSVELRLRKLAEMLEKDAPTKRKKKVRAAIAAGLNHGGWAGQGN